MSEGAIFVLVFAGFFLLRAVIATVVFFWILPDDGRCPNCDALTLRVESNRAVEMLSWLRPSWCYECGWHGVLRSTAQPPSHTIEATPASSHSGRRSRHSG